jgi:hypothetical protein
MSENNARSEAGLTSHESAPGIDSNHQAPLKDSHLFGLLSTDTAVRRRGSDSNCARPLNFAADIELSRLGSLSKLEDSQFEQAVGGPDISLRSVAVDVEQACSSGVARFSVVHASSQNPTTQSPVPSQTTSQRQWGMLQFAMLCYNFFLAGWNDGSTGPLLPTIQRAHNVSSWLFNTIHGTQHCVMRLASL